jgi:hypothetical protein
MTLNTELKLILLQDYLEQPHQCTVHQILDEEKSKHAGLD